MAARTGRRAPLTRERILRAALELADAGGLEALSMRRLGDALGYEAMSLYNHVANKDDVLDGILDLVLAEMEPPDPAGGMASIRSSSVSAHEALTRHPWAASLLMSPLRIRPARLQFMNSLLGALREAGFSAETTYTAYHVLDAHIIGFSLWASTHGSIPANIQDDVRGFLDRMLPVDMYPHLHEHGVQHLEDGPHRKVRTFEYALDLLLDGLERSRD